MSGTKGRVLVIDDDQSMCETLSSALARRNFSVVWSTVGREALALLDHGDFDVVLTDLNMEDLSGLAICQYVTFGHPGLPVVILTAFGTSESETMARQIGAWGFLTKPVDLGLLRNTLSQAVEHGRAARANRLK